MKEDFRSAAAPMAAQSSSSVSSLGSSSGMGSSSSVRVVSSPSRDMLSARVRTSSSESWEKTASEPSAQLDVVFDSRVRVYEGAWPRMGTPDVPEKDEDRLGDGERLF